MSATPAQSLAVGLRKGFLVEKRTQTPRPAQRKGGLGKRTKIVRNLIREVVGMAPYEKRILDIIKTGGSTAEKRAYKFAKRRLGTHSRALKKREDIKSMWAAQRAMRV